MMDSVERDAYRILGVARDADDETIASAFRALARRFHPDIAGDDATRQMMVINRAYDVIRAAHEDAGYTGPAAEPKPARPSPPATPDIDIGWRNRPAHTRHGDGTGGAGRPPGRPSGSVLPFGRHIGWSLGEIARVDPGYLVWLLEKPEGRPYLDEIESLLGRTGSRSSTTDSGRGPGVGVFRR